MISLTTVMSIQPSLFMSDAMPPYACDGDPGDVRVVTTSISSKTRWAAPARVQNWKE